MLRLRDRLGYDRVGLSTIKAELEGRGKSKEDTVGPE
jgi:hypothetical protein